MSYRWKENAMGENECICNQLMLASVKNKWGNFDWDGSDFRNLQRETNKCIG